MSAKDFREVVKDYFQAWLEPDEQKRMALLESVWADGGTYTDPIQQFTGRAAFMRAAATFQARRPGERFIQTSGVDHHHGQLRFAWKWVGADGSTIMEGLDFAELAENGRLRRVTGFFGPLPSAA